jgi:Fe-S cluster biogenesis protein NfuA
MPALARREPTPNPNAFKFRSDAKLITDGGALSLASEADATSVPIASALFRLGSVDAVYIQDDYVSVSANEWADWDEIEGVVKRHLPNFDSGEATRLAAEAAKRAEEAKQNQEPNERLDEINKLIDMYVRPALAGDGGGLEIVELSDDNVLRVRYQGACGTCPSAVAGTLRAIESMIRDRLQDNVTLEAV